MGKPFDRNIGFQIAEIVKGDNDKMNLSDFITQYIDTEDTLNFRIDLDKKRIEELIQKKETFFHEKLDLKSLYEQKGDLLKLYSILNINIKEANNLEPKNFNSEINSYVRITAGDRVFYTVRVTDEKNPEYNQSFAMFSKKKQ